MPNCSSCGAEIMWAKTLGGKSIPLDMIAVANGNVYLTGDVAHVMHKNETAHINVPLYRTHFSSCPNAAKHRKRTA